MDPPTTDMTKSIQRTCALLFAAAVVACVSACSRDVTGTDRAELRQTISSEHAEWRGLAINDYTYDATVWCGDCNVPKDPVRVVVRDGAVTSATRIADGRTLMATQYPMIRTVEGLYSLLQDALERNADSILVRFDTDFHYPSAVQIDYQTSVTGDEVSYSLVSDSFKPAD